MPKSNEALGRTDNEPQAVGDALAQIFQDHREGLAGAVHAVLGPRVEVEEVLQEVFLKAWQAWVRGTRPNNPVSWIFVITMNLARDWRRGRRRESGRVSWEEGAASAIAGHEPAPGNRIEQTEALDAARAAIGTLAEKEQEVFLLRVSAELSFEAIAEALHIPLGTAKTRMRNAIKRLRTSLDAHGPLSIEGGERR